ncbi:MAG: hypothetical protein WAK93_07880, partial [Solirubrobacteraceae bacterium]
PRTLNQEPINVGDPNYNPLFPFGWGLHTSSARADTRTARDLLAGDGREAAAAPLTTLLRNPRDWNANGSAQRPAKVFAGLRRAAGDLQRRSASYAQEDAVVAIARDLAESAMTADGGPNATTSPLFAQADNDLLVGKPARAVELLRQVVT